MKVLRSMVFLIALSLIFIHTSYAQPVKWNWVKGAVGSLAEEGTAVAVDNSGNVYVAGNFYTSSLKFGTTILVNKVPTSTDIFLAKYSPTGTLAWAKSFGSGGNEQVTNIKVDATGNIYMTGYFTSDTLDFGNGNVLNNSSVWTDLYLVKLNSTGNSIWARSAGGLGDDYSNSIAVDGTGNVYITGYYQSDTFVFNKSPLEQLVTPGGFTYDIFIAKYNSNGLFKWVQRAGNEGDDEAYSVAIDNNGNPIITGYFMSTQIKFGTLPSLYNNNYRSEMFLVKYDPSGTALWTQMITGDWDETGKGLATDASGNIYVCGEFSSDNIYIGSFLLTNSGQFSEDIYVAKFNPSGTALLAKSAQGVNTEYAKDISVDGSSNIYVTGTYGSPTMKIGNTTLTNSSTDGKADIYVIKYNTSGSEICAISAYNIGNDDSRSIAAFGNNAYITGTFVANPVINFGSYPLTNTGNSDIFLAGMSQGISIKDEEFDKHFTIYPNPVSDKFTFSATDNNSGKYICKIYDVTGKLITESNINFSSNNTIQVSVPTGYKGLLLIRVTSENGQMFSRSVICN